MGAKNTLIPLRSLRRALRSLRYYNSLSFRNVSQRALSTAMAARNTEAPCVLCVLFAFLAILFFLFVSQRALSTAMAARNTEAPCVLCVLFAFLAILFFLFVSQRSLSTAVAARITATHLNSLRTLCVPCVTIIV